MSLLSILLWTDILDEDLIQETVEINSQATEESRDCSNTTQELQLQEAPHLMTQKEAECITQLLTTQDYKLLQKALVTVANSAAFTQNQVIKAMVLSCMQGKFLQSGK